MGCQGARCPGQVRRGRTGTAGAFSVVIRQTQARPAADRHQKVFLQTVPPGQRPQVLQGPSLNLGFLVHQLWVISTTSPHTASVRHTLIRWEEEL